MLGFAQAGSAPLVHVPIAVLALRRRGIVYRTRQGRRSRARSVCSRSRLPHRSPSLACSSGAGGTVARRRGSRGSGVKVDLKEEEA
ncbi:hypothetical protein E1289_35015 [Actinomadura sp. 6K520]|nr:hypothetical protein E1289_35015 [Actinomadura sp. 6K520]